MFATLESGKEVQGVNSGRGLEGAAYAAATENGRKHLHVYVSVGPFTFVCSTQTLTAGELSEAEGALALAVQQSDEARAKLREELLGPNGDALIAQRQNGNLDGNTASRDIVQALMPDVPYKSNIGSWHDVKKVVNLLRAQQDAIQ